MTRKYDKRDEQVVDFTVQIEEQVAAASADYAERYDHSLDDWVSINLQNPIIATQITDARREGSNPDTEFQPTAVFATPPAFLVPFGPVPALHSHHAGLSEIREYEEKDSDDTPPVIELLPDSNPGSYWTHIVSPGDTLSNIAAQYYGNSALFPRIATANNIFPPYTIYVGQPLTVPKPELSDGQVATFSGGCAAWRTHVVQPGDTLSNIAAQFYGDSGEFWRIAQCNNIQPPSYIIYVGNTLAIPAIIM